MQTRVVTGIHAKYKVTCTCATSNECKNDVYLCSPVFGDYNIKTILMLDAIEKMLNADGCIATINAIKFKEVL